MKNTGKKQILGLIIARVQNTSHCLVSEEKRELDRGPNRITSGVIVTLTTTLNLFYIHTSKNHTFVVRLSSIIHSLNMEQLFNTIS